jgi:diadenosine tetraphosphate (Ap4A) HIT family hydrolase
MAFEIHPRLAVGGHEIGRLGGCRVLLKDNALFPWFLLVPEVAEIEDLHELPLEEFHEVMAAMRRVSEFVVGYFRPEKLNVACIGNQVRQMHLHVVGRSTGDLAWPGTVWAFEGKKSYRPEEIDEIRAAAVRFFNLL